MAKRLRVYDNDGDFIIEIPENAEVTFGYFNPSSPERGKYGNLEGPGGQTMRTTALRIYVKEDTKKHQIACFMGVQGYRDMDSIKLQRIVERVTVEQTLNDDGLGNVEMGRRQKRQLTMKAEGTYGSGGEDIF